MANEKRIEKKLKNEVEKRGGLCLKWVPTFFTGLPDRLILMPGGKVYMVETKAEGGTPDPRQGFVHRQLQALGFTVWIVNSDEQLNKFFNEI